MRHQIKSKHSSKMPWMSHRPRTCVALFRMHKHSRLRELWFQFLILFSSLQWLRGANKNVELELDTIRSNIRSSRFNMDNNMNSNFSSISHDGLPMKYSFKTIVTNVKSVLKNARLVKPVLITCGLMIFQRFTGEWNEFAICAQGVFACGSKPTNCRISLAFIQAQIPSDFMLSKYSARRFPAWTHMAGKSPYLIECPFDEIFRSVDH